MSTTRTTRKQKIGREDSATRGALLDAAEVLMRDEGYAAVTTRKVAAKASVRSQLVHYYFPTMDDLFIALFRRRAVQGIEWMKRSLARGPVLEVLWQQNRDPANATLNLEFMALANHRKRLRAEFARYGDALRRLQHDALVRYFKDTGVAPEIDLQVMTFSLASLGILLALESQSGMSFAHTKVLSMVKRELHKLAGPLRSKHPSGVASKRRKTTARAEPARRR